LSQTASANYNQSQIATGKNIVSQTKSHSSVRYLQPRATRSVSFRFLATKTSQERNEMADKLAKLSTSETSLSPPQGVHYKHVTTVPTLFPRVGHSMPDRHTRWCLLSYLPALLRSSLPIRSLSLIFRLCTGHCKLNHHLSRIGLHPDGLCGQCEIPETVEHMIEVCPKYLTARKRLKLAFNQLGISFHTPKVLCSTAAAKLVETFVRESGVRL